MAHLGNPEKQLRVVHLSGTSGKTSTAYYIAALLTAAGCKVGLTVSPYVDRLNERVQVSGVPLSEEQFAGYFAEFHKLIKDRTETPTWFEVMIAFAYWVFAKENVDYAVIETGLGGLEDSTNVAARADKLCVITDIGYDHMEQLGNTLGKIAYQKAGIIHENNTALMYNQDAEIMKVVRYWVSQQEGADLLTFEQDRLAQVYGGDFPAGLPEYQKRNWLLAFAAYKWLAKRDALKSIAKADLRQSQAVQVPGRMDTRLIDEKTIIMDGAHNGQKMTAFWKSFSVQYTAALPTVLFALKQGKEAADIAPLLAKYAGNVIITTYTKSQDLPVLSQEPSEVARTLRSHGVSCRVVKDQNEAYDVFLKSTDKVGVITGSFFLISQLRMEHPELR